MAITVPLNGYCVVADISGLIAHPNTLDATSVPTATQVETWITIDYQRINWMLRKAGYIAPVVVVGEQLIVGTQLQTRDAHLVNDEILSLDDSGGSLNGTVRAGDIFKITGDSQYYVSLSENSVAFDANILDVEISPPLRVAVAADVDVDYTSIDAPEQILRTLNAHMIAARVEGVLTTAGGSQPNQNAIALAKVASQMWNSIKKGDVVLIGAPRSKKISPVGMARVSRRG